MTPKGLLYIERENDDDNNDTSNDSSRRFSQQRRIVEPSSSSLSFQVVVAKQLTATSAATVTKLVSMLIPTWVTHPCSKYCSGSMLSLVLYSIGQIVTRFVQSLVVLLRPFLFTNSTTNNNNRRYSIPKTILPVVAMIGFGSYCSDNVIFVVGDGGTTMTSSSSSSLLESQRIVLLQYNLLVRRTTPLRATFQTLQQQQQCDPTVTNRKSIATSSSSGKCYYDHQSLITNTNQLYRLARIRQTMPKPMISTIITTSTSLGTAAFRDDTNLPGSTNTPSSRTNNFLAKLNRFSRKKKVINRNRFDTIPSSATTTTTKSGSSLGDDNNSSDDDKISRLYNKISTYSISSEKVAGVFGESALRQVQWLGSRVAAAEASEALRQQQEQRVSNRYTNRVNVATAIVATSNKLRNPYIDNNWNEKTFPSINAMNTILNTNTNGNNNNNNNDKNRVSGTGGSTFSQNRNQLFDKIDNGGGNDSTDVTTTTTTTLKSSGGGGALTNQPRPQSTKERLVWEALTNLEADMQLLDQLAGQRPQLSPLEFTLLLGAVVSCISGPLVLGGQLAEFIAPSAAAFAAAIGVGAEYTGKVAVADGKEIAAASIQCAAEADGFLANAERAKAVTPLCVGIGATAATLALLVPVLLDAIMANVGDVNTFVLASEIYLCCPLIGVLAAAVAGLALQETKSYSSLAIGVGNRRFARSGLVGRTWLSSTELIGRKSINALTKWRTFGFSVIPAPLIGVLVPGALPTKAIIVAAIAAAQSAFCLAQCEYTLARATDAVALKARSAAVCDTYANQGARSAAILPFTSALSGLCAAATAAIVELPFIETLAEARTPASTFLEILAVSTFPTLSALFAAAASVSKARCEVDAEAAMQAASTMALPYDDEKEDPILQPVKGVWELIVLTFSSLRASFKRSFRRNSLKIRFQPFFRWFRSKFQRRKPRASTNI